MKRILIYLVTMLIALFGMSVTAMAMSEVENNNSYSQATVIPANTKVNGVCTDNRDKDWFRFNMPQDGYVNIQHNHYVEIGSTSTMFYVEIYSMDNVCITSCEIEEQQGAITLPAIGLGKGNYYICIRTSAVARENAEYSLEVNPTTNAYWEEEMNSAGDNDSYFNSKAITFGKNYSGNGFKYAGDKDWFRFNVAEDGYVKISFKRTTKNKGYLLRYVVEIMDSKLNNVASIDVTSQNPVISPTAIGLGKGTYYIDVIAINISNSDIYTFNVGYTKAGNWEKESNGYMTNDSISGSMEIKANTEYKGGLLDEDDDYFKVKVTTKGNYSIILKLNTISDCFFVNVEIFNSANSRIDSKRVSGETAYTKIDLGVLSPGVYYVKLCGGMLEGNYEYKVSFNYELSKPSINGVSYISSKSNKVLWSKVSGAAGYYVYRRTAGGKWSAVATIKSGSTTSYKDTKNAGKKCFYTVRAYRVANSVKVLSGFNQSGVGILATPSVKVSSTKSGTASVKWNKVSGATGYYVYRSTGKDGKYKKIKSITKGSTCSFKNSKLKKEKKYYYKVVAIKVKNGVKSNGKVSVAKAVKVK